MNTHSQTPWSFDGGLNIYDANGREINQPDCYDANMAHIVEAVNERDRLRDIVRRLADALDTFIGLEDHEIDLLREAREALGDDAP